MNAATESNLTQAGAVMGTATYFSPEQAQGAQPDPRSDLYSLGIVMYEMVAGRPPFTGENPVSIAYKQVHDHPQPLNQIVADVPRPYEAIVAKLLAKDPKVRYATANALRDDLRRFRNGDQVLALAAVTGAAAAQRRRATGADHRGRGDGGRHRPDVDHHGLPAHRRPGSGAPGDAVPDRRLPVGELLRAAAVADGLVHARRLLRAHRPRHRRCAAVQRPLGRRRAGRNALKDYVGSTLEAAINDLESLGLTYQSVPEEDATVAEDIVHRTDPVAGTIVVENELITLYYNPRKELQEIPSVEGQPLEEAQRILSSAGFQIGTITPEESDSIAENSVIRTDPPAGQQVEQATTINIVVSAGPDQQAVPQIVVGRTEADARQLLENPPYSFKVIVTTEETNDVAAGLVIRANPSVGTLVDIGGTITLVVSSGAPAVDVPNVIGQSESGARDQLSAFDVSVSVPGPPDRRRQRRQGHRPEHRRRAEGPGRVVDHAHRRSGRCPATDERPDDHRRADHHGGPDDHGELGRRPPRPPTPGPDPRRPGGRGHPRGVVGTTS